MDAKAHNWTATVVIADDNADAADTCAQLLELTGHRVQVAYDGAQALELIRTLKPDAAILDLRMPQLDGYQVAQCVRREGLAEVCLIALTGLSRPVDQERAIRSGFDHFLRKPAEPSMLESVVNAAVRRGVDG
jgi:CheY-like chemotaxis protein